MVFNREGTDLDNFLIIEVTMGTWMYELDAYVLAPLWTKTTKKPHRLLIGWIPIVNVV